MKIYKIGEFAKLIGVSTQTLRRWDNENTLKPFKVTDGGSRFYSENQYKEYMGLNEEIDSRIVIGYCRVSSKSQKKELANQEKLLEQYLLSQGKPFEIISDIGSGINYNKKGLNEMIKMITERKVQKIVILYKDRLVRFGFELIENLAKLYGTEIEIVNSTNKSYEEELVEDLIQIITVFSNRIYGKRSYKKQKLNEMIEIIQDDDN